METLRELYGRLVFNILCGNTDDHARKHVAFWDGQELTLTPAYDICPQGRTGNEATQAMLITGENRYSQLKTCIAAAHHFLLSRHAAVDAIEQIETAIRDNWERVCQEAELDAVDKNYLWGRQFLNPFPWRDDPAGRRDRKFSIATKARRLDVKMLWCYRKPWR